MKKKLIVVIIISIILLLIDIVLVIQVSLKVSDRVSFVKNLFYIVAIVIATMSIISIVISIIKLKRM